MTLAKSFGSEIWMSGQFESPELDLKYCVMNKPDSANTVVLMPYAKTVSWIEESFWENLAVHLKEEGYKVFTNVAENEKTIAGTETLSLNILETVQFCSACKAVISLRSGFCDLLSVVTDMPLFVVNPEKENLSSFNVRVLWGRENAYNINLFEKEDQCIEQILKLL